MGGVAQSPEHGEDADDDKCETERFAQWNAPDQV
jgi:hypothetical protein